MHSRLLRAICVRKIWKLDWMLPRPNLKWFASPLRVGETRALETLLNTRIDQFAMTYFLLQNRLSDRMQLWLHSRRQNDWNPVNLIALLHTKDWVSTQLYISYSHWTETTLTTYKNWHSTLLDRCANSRMHLHWRLFGEDIARFVLLVKTRNYVAFKLLQCIPILHAIASS